MKNRNFIKVIAFLLGLFGFIELFSYVFIPKDNNKGYTNLKARGVLSEPKDSLDYLVLGDSEASSSVSPMEIWKMYGYTGFNCGYHSLYMQEIYYFMEELLENQSPKIILLESNVFFRGSKLFSVLKETANNLAKKSFPLFQYHDMWKNFSINTIKEIISKPNYTWNDPFKGELYSLNACPYTKGDYVKKTDETQKIDKIVLFYFNEIVKLCDEKGIKLIIYSTPSPICWTYAEHNGVDDCVKSYGLTYIDLNLCIDELGIDWSKDTLDGGDHVNYNGVLKVTKYIGDYLHDNCNLDDHRNDVKYDNWNTSLTEYQNKLQKN